MQQDRMMWIYTKCNMHTTAAADSLGAGWPTDLVS